MDGVVDKLFDIGVDGLLVSSGELDGDVDADDGDSAAAALFAAAKLLNNSI
jgi:hypothetical protein